MYLAHTNKEANSNPSTQTNVIKGLTPTVFDYETGELLTSEQYYPVLEEFANYVSAKSKIFVETYHDQLLNGISKYKNLLPTGIAQKLKIRCDTSDHSDGIHAAIQTFSSYVLSEDPDKKEPETYPLLLALAPGDRENWSGSYDSETHCYYLDWKCWTRHLIFVFDIPDYIDDYEFSRWRAPSVVWKNNEPYWFLSFDESLTYSDDEKSPHIARIIAGYDMGRVLPYYISVYTSDRKLIAQYKPSSRLLALNKKRETCLVNVSNLRKKIEQAERLGRGKVAKTVRQREEKRLLKHRASVLGLVIAKMVAKELSDICDFHGVDLLVGEDLRWVSGNKWIQGIIQDEVAHRVHRVHTKHATVSATNTSQTCSRCHSTNTYHNNTTREIVCRDCGFREDRDASASKEIAERKIKVYHRRVMKCRKTYQVLSG